MPNRQVLSSCACAYVVALTSENGVDISTRPWTNRRPLWPRPHVNISKAVWCMPSCLSSGSGELVSRIESNMPFCLCVCPYAHAYELMKTRRYRAFAHDVTAAILGSQNNETVAMLLFQINPVGVEIFSYANPFFCFNELHRCWPREWKCSIVSYTIIIYLKCYFW